MTGSIMVASSMECADDYNIAVRERLKGWVKSFFATEIAEFSEKKSQNLCALYG